MALFEEVGITWQGQEYTVPPDKVMGLVAAVEEHITMEELVSGSGTKRVKLASAFAAALKYAGAKGVSPEDVYGSLFSDKGKTATMAINAILAIMIPPEAIQKAAPPSGNAVKKKGAARSSKKPT